MSRYTQYFGKNNVKSELAVGISSIATTIQVNENQGNLRGDKFPVIGTLEHFDSTGKCTKREIVKVESKNGDSFTVVRKFAPCPPSDDATSQSAVSSSFDPGDSFSVYIPYEILNAVSEAINDLYNNGNDRLFLKKTAGLGFEITPGNVRFETGEAYYPGGTGTVVDNSMNYVMLDSSFNIIVETTELFDVQKISIAEVKAVNGEITQITTRKIDGIAGRMGGGGDPIYGDGSDGDLVISENTILNAGQQYQFSNLTICPGVVVSFTGCGGAKIRVANLFCNMGTIDMTDLDTDCYSYRDNTSFCLIENCAWNSKICFGRGGEGGINPLPPYGCCPNCYGYNGTKGNDATNGCGGQGGSSGGACANGIRIGQYGGCPASGYNGGNGADSRCCYCLCEAIPGGGGGGGRYTGNGGNGGNTCVYGSRYSRATTCRTGGNGGNGGILGRGGNGGLGGQPGNNPGGAGGDGGDGYCGGNGGNGSCGACDYYNFYLVGGGKGGKGGTGYYGGNGGNGGNACGYTCGVYCSSTYGPCYQCSNGGTGGQGGTGVIPGTGGNGGCGGFVSENRCGCCSFVGGGRGGTGGQGGTGLSTLHSFNLKAKCICNIGCILSVGAVGGRGGTGGKGGCPYHCVCGNGGQGGRGGNGGQGGNIQIITNCILERGTISVSGGTGGQGGTGGAGGGTVGTYTAPAGSNGSNGSVGESGVLDLFIVEG